MKYLTTMSLITAILLISCNPTKQAAKKVRKAYQLDQGQVAEFCSLQYPPTIMPGDTITKIEYDFIEIECPPVQKPEWIMKTDSTGTISKQGVIVYKKANKRGIVRVDTSRTKVKVEVQKITKFVTKFVKDSAQVALLNSQLNKSKEESSGLRKKLDKRNSLVLWLVIALALSSIVNIIQLKR